MVELPDGIKKFEKKKEHHDHLICENCGTIFEFHNEKIEKIQKEIAKKY
jgi:Fur family ferric uptake transcriptional regulator